MEYRYAISSVRHASVGRFLIALLLVSCFVGCRREKPIVLSGEAQGTFYSVQYYDPQGRNLQQAIDSIFADFDLTASLWVDSSLLRRINRNETDTVNALFASLLQKSIDINRYTDGAFDCRIGRLVQLWGFSFKQREEPDSIHLEQLLKAAHANINLEAGKIVKQDTATELDFNAIAQGYTSDMIGAYLESVGVMNYIINVGGEVLAHGSKANGSLWTVGVERPAANQYSAPEVQTAIQLDNLALVTSGNYRKFYEKDGIKYSHTIDPSTGRPVSHSLLSVSVVDSCAWRADAMATAYMVMGLDNARAFISQHRGEPGTGAVYFIYDNNGEMQTYATPEFEALRIHK